MTKASPTRIRRKAAKQNVAATALKVASHGKTIEVDGQHYVALPAMAFQVIQSALETLAK